MRFFYNTPILGTSDSVGGKFIVRIEDESKKRGYHYIPSHSYIMDQNGIIDDTPFKHLYYEGALGMCRTDGFFTSTIDDENVLIDGNSQIIARGFKDVSPFAPNGFAKIEFEDRSFWINKQGKLFGQEYTDVGEFYNGYAMVTLSNGHKTYVNEHFKRIEQEFEEATPHFVKNFFVVKQNEKYVALRQNFEHYGKANFDRPILITNFGYFVDMDLENGLISKLYDLNGNEVFQGYIFGDIENQRFIRFKRDERYFFFDQKKGKFLGGENGFVYAEDFNGSMAPVGLGFDENNDDMIMTFLKSDGTLFKETYPVAEMLGRNLGAVYVSSKNKVGQFKLVGLDQQLSSEVYAAPGTVSSGMMTYLGKDKRWTAVNEKKKTLPKSYKSLNNFSEDFAVASDEDGIDIISTEGVSLKEISKFAQKICENPNNFIDLPENLRRDAKVVERLFNLAWEFADKMVFSGEPNKLRLSDIKNAYAEYLGTSKSK